MKIEEFRRLCRRTCFTVGLSDVDELVDEALERDRLTGVYRMNESLK